MIKCPNCGELIDPTEAEVQIRSVQEGWPDEKDSIDLVVHLPDLEDALSCDPPIEPTCGFDPLTAFQVAVEKRRADIIADIIGHPQEMPSVEELAYVNPSLTGDAIRHHLTRLVEAGVVQVYEYEVGDRTHGYPYKFYGLTYEARELFDWAGLFPEESSQRTYDAVEKPPRIQELQSMPRPSHPIEDDIQE